MDVTTLISQLFIIIAILTVLVNIITEVVKKMEFFCGSTKRINVFVTLLSIVLTVAVFIAFWQIKQMTIAWYLIAEFIIVGFLVAYAAMFGYDKLISNFKSINKKLND